MTLPAWVSRYIGLPFEACDCWELIRLIYAEQFQIRLPPAPGGSCPRFGWELWDAEAWRWLEIPPGAEQLGDILAFCDPRRGWHAGLVLQPGEMLHTEPLINAIRTRYDRPCWRHRLAGCYRYPAGAGARLPASVQG
jgi:cell wall-associated NlpC family hydrolase